MFETVVPSTPVYDTEISRANGRLLGGGLENRRLSWSTPNPYEVSRATGSSCCGSAPASQAGVRSRPPLQPAIRMGPGFFDQGPLG
jgi:hypothetical protein